MKRSMAMLLTFVMCVVMLTACGGGSSKYAGEWVMVSGSSNGTEIPMEQLEKLMGGKLKMVLESDGTAKVETGTQKGESKWEESDDGIIIYEGDNKSNSVSYKFQDNQLVCTVSGVEMRMEKQ